MEEIMWIMIIKKIPVSKEHQPAPLDIYWAIPWTENKPKISETLKSMNEADMNSLLKKVIKDPDKRPWMSRPVRVGNGSRYLCNQDILNDPEIVERLWDLISAMTFFPGNSLWGFTPNHNGKLRVMVGNEAVGIFPHECSILTKENMEIYLEDSHELVMSDVSKEVFGIFDEDQKFIRDAAMLDGCDYPQASRVALGKKVEFDFPMPFGYYHCVDEIRNNFF